MRNTLLIALLISMAALFSLRAADPTTPVYWSAAKSKELAQEAKSKLSKETGMATSRLMDSAFMVHREKTSQAEAHAAQADFLIINGKADRPGEIRGDSIEGGTPYPVKAGDTLYVPKTMPHQFQVTPGQYIVYTVVKITPVE